MGRLDPRYFPLVLDAVEEGIFTVDRFARITSFNRAAQRITGHRESQVLGRSCASVLQGDLCRTTCPLRHSISSRSRVRRCEGHIQTADGRTLPIVIGTAPLETPGGTLLGGVEVFRDLSHLNALRRQIDGQCRFEDIVSRNPEMHRIFGILPMVAESSSTILLRGSSGTGKELLAKAIHQHGPRTTKPFVAVNCAALPETLLESELFGYRKGAFTDAKRDRVGRIAQAEGGTLFLDEIGDLPPKLQVKLLRFLQEKTYEPLGSSRSVRADVRVIAATHQDLEAMVREGAFRQDLYFRLNVLQIALPRLAERPEDIPLLARHFVDRFRAVTGKPIEGVSSAAISALARYDFPGNIRELENIVERAFILCDEGEIGVDVLPPNILQAGASMVAASASTLDSVETNAIAAALKRHGGNRTRAAAELGIHRTTLLRKLRAAGREQGK
jgi:PAS domain S-box-containing protein